MVFSIEEINARLEKDPQRFINEQENSFKLQIESLSDTILKEHTAINIIMMSGPSSSGKTTTSIMLHNELEKRGHKCHAVSLDNFYNPHLDMEKDTVDLESVYALDLKLLETCFSVIRKGESVKMPVFDFALRKVDFSGKEIRLEKEDCIIVEGIQALNPVITDIIAPEGFVGVYISYETSYADKDNNQLSGRDARLIRRVVRDYNFRGSSVENSLSMWTDVVVGEKNHIEPYRDRAHVRLNSGMLHDVGTLRPYAERLFSSVAQSSAFYGKCSAILNILTKFTAVDRSIIPKTSLLREFIG